MWRYRLRYCLERFLSVTLGWPCHSCILTRIIVATLVIVLYYLNS